MSPREKSSRTRLILLGLLMLAAACAPLAVSGPEGPPPGAPWVSPALTGHPLAGRIWQPTAVGFVGPEAVLDAVAEAPYVLLGEKHDNPDHHRIQAWIVEALVRRGRAPAVVFEMLAEDQVAALAEHLTAHPGDAAGIGTAVGWADSGWPDWSQYEPIAAKALAAGGPILAGNLSRPSVHNIAREGLASLGAERVAALGLDRPLEPALAARLRRDIVESHCSQLPDTMVDPMAAAQTAKDAQMADALRHGTGLAGRRNGAVLIAGAGHARNDLGVPWYLRRSARGDRIVSIGIIEVAADAKDPAAYASHFESDHLPFDFVWFTPRVDEHDPCAAFADQIRRAKERHLQEQQEKLPQ
ncbi:MAG TPA: ChaN family lipoprotein [Kiloniellales bacterium]